MNNPDLIHLKRQKQTPLIQNYVQCEGYLTLITILMHEKEGNMKQKFKIP